MSYVLVLLIFAVTVECFSQVSSSVCVDTDSAAVVVPAGMVTVLFPSLAPGTRAPVSLTLTVTFSASDTAAFRLTSNSTAVPSMTSTDLAEILTSGLARATSTV